MKVKLKQSRFRLLKISYVGIIRYRLQNMYMFTKRKINRKAKQAIRDYPKCQGKFEKEINRTL